MAAAGVGAFALLGIGVTLGAVIAGPENGEASPQVASEDGSASPSAEEAADTERPQWTTRVVLEVDDTADADQVDALKRDLQQRADLIAEEAEVSVDGHLITVTLVEAGDEAIESLTAPSPTLALGLGAESIAEAAPERCETATPLEGFACDREGRLHEIETLELLSHPPSRVETATGRPDIEIEFVAADAMVLAEQTGEAACRDLGGPTLLLLVLEDEIVFSAGLGPDVRCGVGINGGALTLFLGPDATPDEAERLAAELRRAGLPEYSVAVVEEHRPPG